MQTSMLVKKTVFVEVPDLGKRIEDVRRHDPRSLAEICRRIPMTTMHWYRIEREEPESVPLETLRRIEEVLGADFGVNL